MTTPPRVLFYVQHLLGIGHLRRASLIARALLEQGLACDVVLGGPATPGIDWGDARLHQLPELRASDSGFSGLVTADGTAPDDDYWTRRTERLLTIAGDTAPAAILIELYPFGRRAFRRELIPLLQHARSNQPNTLVMCSLRDILVDKGRADRVAETVGIVQTHIDDVLVHGDPAFIALNETFASAAEIADKLVYTGYVAGPVPNRGSEGQGEVIVAAGGGAVGANLLRTALDAKPLSRLADHQWRILMGPNLDAATASALVARAGDGVTVETNRPDYPALLASAAVSVSQGGYNTVMDLVRAGCPAVVVPFATGNETEQTVRTTRLAERGYLTQLAEAEMTPDRLAAAIDGAHAAGRPAALPFPLDGARETARHIKRRIAERLSA